ncbi:undecaprenyldiphospho-muramoylpentapeptide beta-N-acetylglucosaminyltransferase [Alicyclobacillus curvatus]|jgi:UDP-N-acetylglucosamine--N-acetylmuramyl-(pentapeptide) pyrophosphoryl-undecaprenol N-acetylglucosamine transferase|nr:undecaprenyldiphospho-muramoylpentapeptide beta-N-acetylglucosaminyltransferase [Alicyclobacillus curvatus]
MRILVTGGGTGGHVYPALTVWNYILRQHPDAEVLYIGSEKGLEKDIVPRTGIPFATIPAAGLRRELSLRAAKTAWLTLRGYRQAKRLVRRFRPDVVLGTGGYVTLPVVYAAARLKVPAVVWEANARPGMTNQLCARKATAVAVCFPGGERFFPKGTRLVLTGNPRGSEVLEVPAQSIADAKKVHGIRDGRKLIVGYMGSRGAETVNRVVSEVIPRFADKPDWQLLYVTGSAHYDEFCAGLPRLPHNVQVVPFLHDMPSILPSAAAVLTRAGGATLSEICALGLASVIVPSPYVTANHQEENARRLFERSACEMVLENELTADKLWAALAQVLDTSHGDELRQNARLMATDHAVRDLYDLLMDALQTKEQRTHQ